MNKLELVILLNGNFIPIPVLDKKQQQELSDASIIKLIKEDPDHPFVFINGCCFRANSVVGWYWRTPPTNNIDKMVKLVEKSLDTPGEDWKNGE